MSDTGIYLSEQEQSDANSITMLRILDVLYHMYWEKNPDMAKKLIDLHAAGGLSMPPINFNTDEML